MTEEVIVVPANEPTTPRTFMQAVYEGAKQAAVGVHAEDLKGISKQQFLEGVWHVTEGLNKMPDTTSMHAALFAVTFVRNAIIMALQEGQARMAGVTVPNA